MPAPAADSFVHSLDARSLGHVNLMVDTFIANASVEEQVIHRVPDGVFGLTHFLFSLRATVRTLLATTPPHTAAAFTRAARVRLGNVNARTSPRSLALFTIRPEDGEAIATKNLHDVLTQARSLYGAGMGFASLAIFASIVRLTHGLRWTMDGETADTLTLIDGDICQAIQSSKEEVEGGRADDLMSVREKVGELKAALQGSISDVTAWGGEFPFERAVSSLDCWKI